MLWRHWYCWRWGSKVEVKVGKCEWRCGVHEPGVWLDVWVQPRRTPSKARELH
jgi:hypothetical protein